MKILLSWLREFVDAPGTADQIAATMSVRGFALEGLEVLAGPGERTAPDTVLDFEITANRPDCLSVSGFAREVATAYGVPLRAPAADSGLARLDVRTNPPPAGEAGIDIVIENAALCPRYVGAVADVAVGPSPDWMQHRLKAAGIRPISNIVDVTNYVLLELGHPMHAFDLERLDGAEIRVRTARTGETIRTLDGQSRTLTADMLVIADRSRPVAVAGVMGGADSEVSGTTKAVVLESAFFDARSVRQTSKRLGLKTEASLRFERGADPELPVAAMCRAVALLEHIGAGRARGIVVDRYPVPVRPRVVLLRRRRLDGLLGWSVPDPEVARILIGLGFALADAAVGEPAWSVSVPPRRGDVAREVDLIEEIARHAGFDRVPARFPPPSKPAPPIDPRITRARQLRAALTGAGFLEAMTFGFVAEAAAAAYAPADDVVPIRNPLSDMFAVLRPSLLPGLVESAAHNRRREQRDVRLFEIGSRFLRRSGEGRALACVWTGAASPGHWSGSGRSVDFFDLKGLAERIGLTLGVDVETTPREAPWLVSGRSAALAAGGRTLGLLGQLDPLLAARHDIPATDPVFVLEIDLDAADRAAGGPAIRVTPLPRYPSATRDVSVLVADTLPAERLRRTIRDLAPPTLVSVREFDRYLGKGIPEGRVSLSLRLTFRSPDRTLTDAEVQRAVDDILAALQREHGAVQR